MNKRRVRLLLLTVFTFPLLTTSVVAGDATWVEVKSPHFSVFTDAGEKRGREVATRFEQMRAVFGQLMTRAKVNTPIPLEIVAFRNNKELRQVAPLWNGKPIELAGLFQGGSDRCFIMLDLSTENPWSTVFHEYAHQLMSGTLSSQSDPWFVEGFAEYFSTIEVDSHHANVGKIPSLTYEIIREQGMMKVSDLFRVQQNSSTYNENGSKRTVFYAESAMVVHYLYDNNMVLKLGDYFQLKYEKNLPVEDAIQQAFGMSAGNFNKTIERYVASGQSRYFAMKTPPDIETTGYTTRAVTAVEAASVVADIHAHSPDYQAKAVAEFEEILKTDPGNATANRGLGYSYLQKKDLEKAGEHFKRAAKADAKDSRVHYYSGVLMNMAASGDSAELASVIEELKTAINLDPDFADAYMQLAIAQTRASNLSDAIGNAKKAISLNPGNQAYYFNLAGLYMQERKWPEALSIYRALTKNSDPAIASQASRVVEQMERAEAARKEMEAGEQSSNEGESRLVLRQPQSRSDEDRTVDVHVAPRTSVTNPAVSANPVAPTPEPVKFIKGTIVSVDCSSPPGAAITMLSSGKRWVMQVRDSQHVLVLGGGGFSCGWKGQKIALNYRETGAVAGNVVSIEIQ